LRGRDANRSHLSGLDAGQVTRKLLNPPVIQVEGNLRYVSLNQRLADLNGAPVAAHIGRKVQEMIPELFPQVQPFLLRALKGEAIEGVEAFKPSSESGEPGVTILLSYQPAIDETQEVIGISVAIVDIRERKRAEDARKRRTPSVRKFT